MLNQIPFSGPFRGLDCDSMSTLELARTNVVYGPNGTGKTSLSEAFRMACANSPKAPKNWIEDAEKTNIRVFNQYYVNEELHEFLDGSSAAPALAIGRHNRALKTRQQAIMQQIKEQKESLGREEQTQEQIPSLRDIAAEAKQSVLQKLQGLDPHYHKNEYRNTEALRTKIASLDHTPNDIAEVKLFADARLKALSSKAPGVIVWPSSRFDLDVVNGIIDECTRGDAVSTQDRPAPRVLSWLREGLSLFNQKSGNSSCPFCDHEVSDARLYALESTLSSESSRRLEELKEQALALHESLRDVRSLKDQLGWISIPHEDFDKDLEIEKRALLRSIQEWETWAGTQIDAIDALADAMPPHTEPIVGPPNVSLEPINSIIQTYAEKLTDAESLRQQALEELELRTLSPYARKNRECEARRKDAKGRCAAHEEAIAELAGELRDVEDQLTDTTVAAQEMTTDLRSAVGMYGFSITPDESRTAYHVTRTGGGNAEHLSEGERNIIALLYFLRSLEVGEPSPGSLTVIIDDPGKTLDADNITAVLELIRSRSKKWAQTFVLTHSIFALKQAQRIWSPPSRDPGGNGAGETESRESAPELAVFMTRAVENSPNGSPQWTIGEMPRALRDFGSDYEYAYWTTIVAAAGDLKEDMLPAVANTARRALEGLIAFHCPGSTNLRNGLDTVWSRIDQENRFSALKCKVIDFMNRSSHGFSSPGGSSLWPGVTEDSFHQAVGMMALIDRNHFNNLVEAFDWLPEEDRRRYKKLPSKYFSLLEQSKANKGFDPSSKI